MTRRLRIALGGALAAPLLAWLSFLAAVAWKPYPRELLEPRAASSFTALDAGGRVLRQMATSAGGRESWISLDRISPHLVDATLCAEDRRFWSHGGVDLVGVARAAWLDLKAARAAYGASTITMQLVRLVDPARRVPRRSFADKAGEAVMAARLERVAGKREILEQYLNRAYYGNGAWGAEAAAQIYFGKPAAALSLGEAAFLAVLPRGPRLYDPYRHLARALARRGHILGLMRKEGRADQEGIALAERVPLGLRRDRPDFRAPHFVDYLLNDLTPEEQESAVVRTTLDGALQEQLEVSLRDHLGAIGRNVGQAGLVVLRNSDGAILSMIGSRSYFDPARDGAANVVSLRRRPGSTLKPFVYALALENGDTPSTLSYDIVLGEDARETYALDIKQHGPARYREALAGSYNLSAVHTLKSVGVPRLVALLERAGLSTMGGASYGPALAIGEAEVRVIELAAAFAAFGNGGKAVVPSGLRGVAAPRRPLRSPAPREGVRLFSPQIAYLVFDILSDPDARRPMFGDRVPMDLPFPVALKTGTTRAYTDNLAFGVTREYTVGAWAGNFDGSPTDGVMAMQGAAPLVRAAYVALAARFGAPTAPPRPEGIVEAAICPLSGARPGPSCPARKREIFQAGSPPGDTCAMHGPGGSEDEPHYPREIEPWVRARGRPFHAVGGASFQIVSPRAGARFLIDPRRPLDHQVPPLRATPLEREGDVAWTIDGRPVGDFRPSPGVHSVHAEWRGARDEVEISFD